MDTPGQEGQTTILKNMKYEFVNGKDDIPCIVENKKCLKPPTSIRLETKQDFQELWSLAPWQVHMTKPKMGGADLSM